MNKEWIETTEFLEREFVFKDFPTAMAWMQSLISAIEAHDHHPEWCNIYNKVKVKLTTHSAGNRVTEKDHQLAQMMDKAFDA